MRALSSCGLFWASVASLVGYAGACTGRIDGTAVVTPEPAAGQMGTRPTGAGGNGSGTTTGETGGNTAPSSDVAIATSGPPPAESAGPLLMRRLTYREYDHMLADLLGDASAPAEGGSAWSPDAPNVVGLVAPNRVADLQVNLYRQTADAVCR